MATSFSMRHLESLERRMLLAADGSVFHVAVAGGDGRAAVIQSQDDAAISVTMFKPNGALDKSFGERGTRQLGNIAGGAARRFGGAEFAPDGDLLIAGVWNPPGKLDLPDMAAVFRLNPDGTTDKSFGRAGVARGPRVDLMSLRTGEFPITAMRVDPRGGIILRGDADLFNDAREEGLVDRTLRFAARFNPDGTLDRGFNTADMQRTLRPSDGVMACAGNAFNSPVNAASLLQLVDSASAAAQQQQQSSSGNGDSPHATVNADAARLAAAMPRQDALSRTKETAEEDKLAPPNPARPAKPQQVHPPQPALPPPRPRTAELRGTKLLVAGTRGNDHITILRVGGRISVQINSAGFAFDRKLVRGISIDCDAGDDVVVIGSGVMGVYVFGGEGNDRLRGGDGDDTLLGGAGNDTIEGGAGNDLIRGGGGRDFLYGGKGDDRIFGDDANDYIDGGDGNDALDGGAGSDILRGGKGDDHLSGGSGNDKLYGDAGNDTLDGGAGDDRLFGGEGIDVLIGGLGHDRAIHDRLDAKVIVELLERN